MEINVVVDGSQAGERLDKYLSGLTTALSRSAIQDLIGRGNVTVNGDTISKKNHVLSAGDMVRLIVDEEDPLPIASDLDIDIRYEDQWLMVINKPVGMVVHPAPGHYADTLVNALLGQGTSLSDLGEGYRPGIVHRLDKETSGLMLVAKTNNCHWQLSEMLRSRRIQRTYLTLVRGYVSSETGIIEGPIGRHPKFRTKMAVVPEGKPAVTEFRVLRRFPGCSLVQARLQTGRTHQIRVHFSHLGWPVVGDKIYGSNSGDKKYAGQMLHARTLKFVHPVLNTPISVTAEPPEEFLKLLRKLAQGDGEAL
jgi:23S rRNA pseudouridine1911/1915/1917 synthase